MEARRFIPIAAWAITAIALVAILAVAFQYGVRYRYEQIGGMLWRVDQLTGQHCRVVRKGVDCGPLRSVSTSTSTSVSVSTSLSVKSSHAVKGKHG